MKPGGGVQEGLARLSYQRHGVSSHARGTRLFPFRQTPFRLLRRSRGNRGRPWGTGQMHKLTSRLLHLDDVDDVFSRFAEPCAPAVGVPIAKLVVTSPGMLYSSNSSPRERSRE